MGKTQEGLLITVLSLLLGDRMPKKQTTRPNDNFSKTLEELRNIAIAITKDKRVRVLYIPDQPTSAFNMETYQISLSLHEYPDFVRTHERTFRKVLDGDLGHECGHLVLTRPLWEYFNNWVTKIKRQRGFFKLAHEISNIVEDKRINHFIILRYRFDIGKRLLLANLILKDMIDNTMEPRAIMKGNFSSLEDLGPHIDVKAGMDDGVYMMAILCNQGLYEAKCTELWNKMKPEAVEDCKKAMKILEDVEYKRLRIDIVKACQDIYVLVAKHLKADYSSKEYICSRRGGNVKGKISQQLAQALESEERKEEEQEKSKEKLDSDLQKGAGAGEGTGNEISAPDPNFEAYSALLDQCKPQITELLNLLKKRMKPRTTRQIFERRGRLMSPIVPQIYTNSFRGTVKNVFTKMDTRFEREQLKIGFMFDFSGSVDRHEAEKILTILQEVFGHYVTDGDFAITCFGADSQRLKVFNEGFANTRARAGNIGVDAGGTEMSVLLEAFAKMFSCFKEEKKVLVIASDFCTSDEDKCVELLGQYAKMGVEVYMIGFDSCEHVDHFAEEVRGLKVVRTKINEISELPLRFLECWTSYQMDKR